MGAAERNRFPKSARLSLKKDIDHLFDSGQSFIAYPLRIVYVSDAEANPSESDIAVLVGIPKKRIKRAVDRNRLKRLIREAFRLNRQIVTPQAPAHLHIAFMYVSNEIASYADIEKAMLKALKLVNEKAMLNTFSTTDKKTPGTKRSSVPAENLSGESQTNKKE